MISHNGKLSGLARGPTCEEFPLCDRPPLTRYLSAAVARSSYMQQ